MGKMQREKGKRFERELAAKLKEAGFDDVRRSAQYAGNTGEAADLIGLDYIHIEAKHQETMRLYEWMEQAIRDSASSSRMPTVFHRQNNKPTLVTMLLDDWISMYREYYMSMKDALHRMEDDRSGREENDIKSSS